jgi:hypothetical protein
MPFAGGGLIRALDTVRENKRVELSMMKRRRTDAELNALIEGRSNNSFNASGRSLDVIRWDWMPLSILPAALIRALCRSAKTEAVALTQVEGQKHNARGSFQRWAA